MIVITKSDEGDSWQHEIILVTSTITTVTAPPDTSGPFSAKFFQLNGPVYFLFHNPFTLDAM